jgi:nuclease HARBI1
MSDPFALPDTLFRKNFRLNRNLALELIDELKIVFERVSDGDPDGFRNDCIPFHCKVLCALHFYATGSYQGSVGENHNIVLAQTNVSRVISLVSLMICELLPQYIQFPVTVEAKLQKKAEFYNLVGIRGTIGAIDCTHVEIISPPSTDEEHLPHLYRNRKKKVSINVQIIADANYKILAADAKFPGSTHDAAIWHVSI